jgi:hypothetical protein
MGVPVRCPQNIIRVPGFSRDPRIVERLVDAGTPERVKDPLSGSSGHKTQVKDHDYINYVEQDRVILEPHVFLKGRVIDERDGRRSEARRGPQVLHRSVTPYHICEA